MLNSTKWCIFYKCLLNTKILLTPNQKDPIFKLVFERKQKPIKYFRIHIISFILNVRQVVCQYITISSLDVIWRIFKYFKFVVITKINRYCQIFIFLKVSFTLSNANMSEKPNLRNE